MKFFVWFNFVILWLAVICTRNGTTALLNKKCRKDVDCKTNSHTCHGLLKICVKKRGFAVFLGKLNPKPTTCKKCLAKEYCHPIFKTCLPILTLPSTRNNKKPTAADCKQDRDCTNNRYCHRIFKKCLDILVIPTMSTPKTSAQSCRNDSTCANNSYCHDFFKICLVRPTLYQNTSTTPRLKYNCTTDIDCHPGQYCQNMTRVCQRVKKLSGSGLPSPASQHARCKTDSDCSKNEICHRLFRQRVPVAVTKRHRHGRCGRGMGCLRKRRRHTTIGVCVKHRSTFKNCSRDEDCGPDMCCLTKLGMCNSVSKRGDPCVTQASYFTCPCSANLFCKPNSKKRKLKGKRLERRLKLSTQIRKQLGKPSLFIHKKYMYGKCHQI